MASEFRAWMPRTPGPEFDAALEAALGGEVRLATGTGPPGDADCLVAGRPREEELDACPSLRTVVIPFAGVPPATRELLRARPGLALHNLHHNAASTAETAVGLLLAASLRIVPHDRALRAGDWRPRYGDRASVLLSGHRAVVAGYGAVGRRVAAALAGLGMAVDAVRRRPAERGPGTGGVTVHGPDALDALLPGARAVVLCVPLTEETRGLLSEARLALLPPEGVLVNVARGEVVDEEALFAALRDRRLRAAGIDTWWAYPASEEERAGTAPSRFPFGDLDNAVLSPHRGGLVEETEGLRARALAELLLAAARGEPVPHRVDVEAGY